MPAEARSLPGRRSKTVARKLIQADDRSSEDEDSDEMCASLEDFSEDNKSDDEDDLTDSDGCDVGCAKRLKVAGNNKKNVKFNKSGSSKGKKKVTT